MAAGSATAQDFPFSDEDVSNPLLVQAVNEIYMREAHGSALALTYPLTIEGCDNPAAVEVVNWFVHTGGSVSIAPWPGPGDEPGDLPLSNTDDPGAVLAINYLGLHYFDPWADR